MTLFAGLLRDELPATDERRGHVEQASSASSTTSIAWSASFSSYARRPKPELADVPVADCSPRSRSSRRAPPRSSPSRRGARPRSTRCARDRGQLRRALLNLARNAVQAAAAAGHRGKDAVAIRARALPGAVEIVVWNRGAEISPETSGKLFEPFYTTREQGTGLGSRSCETSPATTAAASK